MGEEPRDAFAEVIGSAEELREHYRRPARFVVDKLMDRLDDNFRAYIGSLPPDRAPRCHGSPDG